MFSDPLVAVMAMLLLFFFGMLLVFLFIIRSLGAQRSEMREAFRKQQLMLADLERQIMELNFSQRKLPEEQSSQHSGNARASGTLDMPLLRGDDDLMSMLENAARPKTPAPAFDDLLLPQAPKPQASKAQNPDEYDPAADPHLFEDSFIIGGDDEYEQRKNGRTDRERAPARGIDPKDLLLLRKDG